MNILYYCTPSRRKPAEEYVDGLPYEDRVVIAADLEDIREMGILKSSVSRRKMQGKRYKGLWEIKTGTGTQQRIFCCLIKDNTMVLLHACKKQKEGAQHGDVEIARSRMIEVLSKE